MKRRLLVAAVLLLTVLPAPAFNVSDLHQLVGYTLLEITSVPGDFEGADFDKVIKLSNGMIFEFQSYNYAYAYMPDVAVFARALDVKSSSGRSVLVYKLIVEDEIYDVRRIR